jgi:hypothetical protein
MIAKFVHRCGDLCSVSSNLAERHLLHLIARMMPPKNSECFRATDDLVLQPLPDVGLGELHQHNHALRFEW